MESHHTPFRLQPQRRSSGLRVWREDFVCFSLFCSQGNISTTGMTQVKSGNTRRTQVLFFYSPPKDTPKEILLELTQSKKHHFSPFIGWYFPHWFRCIVLSCSTASLALQFPMDAQKLLKKSFVLNKKWKIVAQSKYGFNFSQRFSTKSLVRANERPERR